MVRRDSLFLVNGFRRIHWKITLVNSALEEDVVIILLSRSHCRMQLRSVHSARWSWIVYKVTAGGRGVSLMTNHLGLTALHCRSGNGHQKHDCMHDILYLCVAPYVVTIIIIILNKLS